MMISKEACEELRRALKVQAEEVGRLRGDHDPAQSGEIISNVVLAYRHLEDASMRLGKAIQAIDGGVSVYDKSQVPGA
jgi:hypothetical protein